MAKSVEEPQRDPDMVRLNPVISQLVDQLVARRQTTRGPRDASRARAEVLREVLAEGIAAVQRREGMGA